MRVSGPTSAAMPLAPAQGAGPVRRAADGAAVPAAPAAAAPTTPSAPHVTELSPLERAGRNAPAAQAVAAENRRAAESARGDLLTADRLP